MMAMTTMSGVTKRFQSTCLTEEASSAAESRAASSAAESESESESIFFEFYDHVVIC